MTTAELSRPKRGRPKGAKAINAPILDVASSRCNKCKSTRREKYKNVNSHECSGTSPNGNPFNVVWWRHTKCKNCGEPRTDKFYEYEI